MTSKRTLSLVAVLTSTSIIMAMPGQEHGLGCRRAGNSGRNRPDRGIAQDPQDGRGRGRNQGNGCANGAGPYQDGTGPRSKCGR